MKVDDYSIIPKPEYEKDDQTVYDRANSNQENSTFEQPTQQLPLLIQNAYETTPKNDPNFEESLKTDDLTEAKPTERMVPKVEKSKQW